MSDATLNTLIGIMPTTILALATLIQTIKTGKKVEKVHAEMNGLKTELVDSTAKASRAEGVAEGMATGKAQEKLDQAGRETS